MIRASKRHLDEVGEGYFEHLRAALGFAFALGKASIACGLHAIIPAFCTRTASSSVAQLQAKLLMRAALASGSAARSEASAERKLRSDRNHLRTDA